MIDVYWHKPPPFIPSSTRDHPAATAAVRDRPVTHGDLHVIHVYTHIHRMHFLFCTSGWLRLLPLRTRNRPYRTRALYASRVILQLVENSPLRSLADLSIFTGVLYANNNKITSYDSFFSFFFLSKFKRKTYRYNIIYCRVRTHSRRYVVFALSKNSFYRTRHFKLDQLCTARTRHFQSYTRSNQKKKKLFLKITL